MAPDLSASARFTHLVPFFCALVILGAVVYSLLAPPMSVPVLDTHSGARAVVEGVVVEDPDIRESSARLTLHADIVNGTRYEEGAGKIIVITSRYTPIAYGDRIRVNGIVKAPESFDTGNGRTFDYPNYLRAHGISYQMSFANITTVAHGEGNPVIGILLGVKHALQEGLGRAFPEPESALAGGILLGEKRSLGDELTEAFRRAGLVHIIVLSGYNVSVIIAALLFVALRVMPRLFALAVAGACVVLFTLMTGASETTVRAAAMAGLVLLAKGLDRPADALRILLIVAAGMALWNPFLVLYDLSYQLSILATLGLVLFSTPIEKHLAFVPEVLGLRQIVAATLATQASVLPLLIVSMGQVSLAAFIANPAVLPAVELAMLFSFLAGVIALLSPTLALPFSFPAYLLLHFIVSAAQWFASLPFAALAVPASWQWFTLGALALFYLGAFRYFATQTSVPQPFRSGF